MVEYELGDAVGIIRVNNPPVNALSHEVRRGILGALNCALADKEAKAIVLSCSGRTFIAGANIHELGTSSSAPTLPEVTAAIEASTKPVVCLMHGNAMGGGLEIALASHYRIAAEDTQFGMPEVNLGLIPGAGGTQRLPRLVGISLAINMIARGERIDAGEALSAGLIDHIYDSASLFQKGCEFAVNAGQKKHAIELASARSISSPEKVRDLLYREEGALAKKARGRQAPLIALKALRAAVDLPFDKGCARERLLFLERIKSSEHHGLKYAFLAEKQSFHLPGLNLDEAKTIHRVAVIGAGTMGRGIAISILDAGLPVCLFDVDNSALEKGVEVINQHYDRMTSKGRLDSREADKRRKQLSATLDYQELSDADLVIEAAIENLEIKRRIFSELDRVCHAGAILATNTSTLDIDQIAEFTSRPRNVLGVHFFSPANIMRLMEIVSGKQTSAITKATVMKFAKRLRKVAVLVENCFGFVGNRILYRRLPEALSLVSEGASPLQVDRVLKDFGFPMGQFAISDLAGLDVGYRAREERRKSGENVPRSWLDEVVEAGRLGQKNGLGVYKYLDRNPTPMEDPDTLSIIEKFRETNGIKPRTVADEEILARCLYVMVNEGFKILDEGIARSEMDIDVVWNCGFGFPTHRGGLMFWARQVGLQEVLDKVTEFYQLTGEEQWRPAAALVKAVDKRMELQEP